MVSIQWYIDKLYSYGDKAAIIYADESYSYSALLQYYERWKERFLKIGIKPGEIVAIAGDHSPDACALILALAGNSNIIVLTNTSAKEEQQKLLRLAQCQYLFEVESGTVKHSKLEYRIESPLFKQLIEAGTAGLVLFTSGATGEHKGVVHNFSKLLDKYKASSNPFRTLAFLLLDHIGGINTLLHTLSCGGTVIVTKKRSPEDICKIIETHKVEILPTSPTFLNILIASGVYRKYDLSSLQVITYGTEAMSEGTLTRLNEILPNIKYKQTYGLSELGIMSTKSAAPDSLWMKLGGKGYESKIVNGVLYIRAESAMLGYLNAPNPFDEEGWFNTQDQVLVDGDNIRILGRNSEIINVGGKKVYPVEVEDIIMQMDNIKNVVVKGERNPLMGYIVVAKVNLYEPESIQALKNRIRAFCKDKIEPYKVPVKIEVVTEEVYNSRFKKVRV